MEDPEGESIVRIRQCTHCCFHRSCLVHWVSEFNNDTCPRDRRLLFHRARPLRGVTWAPAAATSGHSWIVPLAGTDALRRIFGASETRIYTPPRSNDQFLEESASIRRRRDPENDTPPTLLQEADAELYLTHSNPFMWGIQRRMEDIIQRDGPTARDHLGVLYQDQLVAAQSSWNELQTELRATKRIVNKLAVRELKRQRRNHPDITWPLDREHLAPLFRRDPVQTPQPSDFR
jgi:hypothetical protein